MNIRIGGQGVHKDSGNPAALYISPVITAPSPTATFDFYRNGFGTSANISEAQASELIDALEEAFPDLAPHVEKPQMVRVASEEDLILRAAARALAVRFRNWDRLPLEEIRAFLAAVEGLNS